MHNFKRLLQLPDISKQTTFLWGPRKTGKSYIIENFLETEAIVIDLLKSDVFAEYSLRPSLLRERYQTVLPNKERLPIVIDEIQKCPALLDEVQWLITNVNQNFLLTGSSARKLKQTQANLLGGRAWRRELKPLVTGEIEDFDLDRALKNGLLPLHYLSDSPQEELRGYVADYLKEEIANEATVRNLPVFGDFLKIAAITSGQLLNYNNIAREIGINNRTVRNYYEILEDTLLGFRISPWTKSNKIKLVESDKFYLFDIGVTNYLSRRISAEGTFEYGFMFEQFIMMELTAYRAYKNPEMEIRFWRTYTKKEVNFVIDDLDIAIEVKASKNVHQKDLKHLTSLYEDKKVGTRLVISQDKEVRTLNDRYGKIYILPWQEFCKIIWNDGIDALKKFN